MKVGVPTYRRDKCLNFFTAPKSRTFNVLTSILFGKILSTIPKYNRYILIYCNKHCFIMLLLFQNTHNSVNQSLLFNFCLFTSIYNRSCFAHFWARSKSSKYLQQKHGLMAVKRKKIHNLDWQKLVLNYRRDINKFPKLASESNSDLKVWPTYRQVYIGRSISTRLDTKHPWAEEIQVCSNKGPGPSQRGDKSEIVKLFWKYRNVFKNPISTKFGTKHPWVDGIQITNKGLNLPQGDLIAK